MPPETQKLAWFCPAKLNLRLAVVGRRDDGFHELKSVVTPITLYDELIFEWRAGTGEHSLTIEESDLEPAADNLVLRAMRAFGEHVRMSGHFAVTLRKRIPVGAGLGGGSSNAAGTLLALQSMWGFPLEPADLEVIAIRLGADVPFFLHPEPAIMRGLGEDLTPALHLAEALADRQILVFKPSLGISTAWAYGALAEAEAYQAADDEEALLAAFEHGTRPLRELPFNAFRAVVDIRYPTIPVLLKRLNAQPGVAAEMSGSGSACFALYRDPERTETLVNIVRECWGPDAFVQTVQIA